MFAKKGFLRLLLGHAFFKGLMTKPKKLTKEQGIILTGFTGVLMCAFSDYHKDVEKRLGRLVLNFMFGDKDFAEKITELYREDFMAMLPEKENDQT